MNLETKFGACLIVSKKDSERIFNEYEDEFIHIDSDNKKSVYLFSNENSKTFYLYHPHYDRKEWCNEDHSIGEMLKDFFETHKKTIKEIQGKRIGHLLTMACVSYYD